MSYLTIRKSIKMNAPKEKVWDVLVQEKYMKEWYAVFAEGARAETDWKEGSKARFTDHSGDGMVGRIAESRPGEALTIEFTGMLLNGKEDTESEEAKAVQGGREVYRLSEENGATTLSIESDMTEEYYDMMTAKWEEALQKIKSLAENS